MKQREGIPASSNSRRGDSCWKLIFKESYILSVIYLFSYNLAMYFVYCLQKC